MSNELSQAKAALVDQGKVQAELEHKLVVLEKKLEKMKNQKVELDAELDGVKKVQCWSGAVLCVGGVMGVLCGCLLTVCAAVRLPRKV